MIEERCKKCDVAVVYQTLTCYPPINTTTCPSCGHVFRHEREPINVKYLDPDDEANSDDDGYSIMDIAPNNGYKIR